MLAFDLVTIVNFLGPDFMDTERPLILKVRRLIRLTIRQFKADVVETLDPTKFVTASVGAFVTTFVALTLFGDERLISEVQSLVTSIIAGILATPIVLMIKLLTAPFRAQTAETSRGQWYGRQFIYYEPQHALTVRWLPSDNGKQIPFRFDDAEPGSLVSCKMEVQGGGDRLEVFVGNCSPPWRAFQIHTVDQNNNVVRVRFTGKNSTSRLSDDGYLLLQAESMPDTVPSTIRVYVTGFEIPAKGDTGNDPEPNASAYRPQDTVSQL